MRQLFVSRASGPDTASTGSEETASSGGVRGRGVRTGSGELSAEHPLGHGPCTEDVMNVQNAILKAARSGGKVILKTDGDTAFHFGTFVPQTGEEWLRYGVHVFTGVTIEGEKNADGTQATIENGYIVMRGLNLKGSGKLEISGIHFKNFGATAVYLEGIAENVSVVIRDNKITADYYNRFSGTEALDKYINTDDPKLVDGPMSPQEDPGMFMKAVEKLIFNPALDFQQQGGGVYPVREWWSMAINSQMVLGDVLIENNYIDLEEGSELPAVDTHVWWHTVGLLYGNVHGSITNRDKDALPLGILGGSGHSFNSVEIVDNTVALKNGSAGITVQDVENALIARNTLEGDYRVAAGDRRCSLREPRLRRYNKNND